MDIPPVSTSSLRDEPEESVRVLTQESERTDEKDIDFQDDAATFAVTRTPVNGLEEAAMDNYSHIHRPLVFPSAQGPQAPLEEQSSTFTKHPTPQHSGSDSQTLWREPQHATTDISAEKLLAQTITSAIQGDTKVQIALGDMYVLGNRLQ